MTINEQHAEPLYADVVFDLPIETSYQYTVPKELRGTICPGSLVHVPFRKRALIGCVVSLSRRKKFKTLKPIESAATPGFALDQDLLNLGAWLSEYYFCTLGEALACISFIGFHDVAEKTQRVIRLADYDTLQGETQRGVLDISQFTPKQKLILDFLLESGNEPIVPAELRKKLRVGMSVINTLIHKGHLVVGDEVVERPDGYDIPVSSDVRPVLNSYQSDAFEKIVAALAERRYASFLLFGITGSGKTEVYLRAIERALSMGREAIVLVSEIALTPQTVERFRSRFHDTVGVYHSRLSLGQKFDLWKSIKSGRTKIVVGARSAVFSPFPNLGLIVIDEEHETTYKQSDVPRYNTRDVGVMRAKERGAIVILGSATPSLESYHNAQIGKHQLLKLPERVEQIPLPQVTLVDMSRELKERKNPELFSGMLVEAIEKRLDAHEQTILFLNRRGFSNFLLCLDCNKTVRCDRCDVTMTYHKIGDRLVCHYCNRRIQKPSACPSCGGQNLNLIGMGTERIEEELSRRFFSARVTRVDLDTMKSRGAILDLWRAIARNEVDIILGTQMIAKGFHLENVTLVGVVSADFSLFLPDFRSAERTFSLLTQVAGRSGRSPKGGVVIIQTYVPNHYAIIQATQQNYEAFAEKELHIRKVLRFPPFYRLLSVTFSGAQQDLTRNLATKFGYILQGGIKAGGGKDISVLGPAPAPISRIKGRYRWHLLIRGNDHKTMRALLLQALERYEKLKLKSTVKIAIDMDPLDLL